MIGDFKDLDTLFKNIDEKLKVPVSIYVIGGAALLYRGLKKATKDIDIILWSHEEFTQLLKVLKDDGFKGTKPTMVYSNMNLSELLKKDDFRIDMFEKQVCGKFSLSKEMIKRAEKIVMLKSLKVYLCSNEDIFLFKTMTERPGDIDDCVQLATNRLDWEAMYKELISQTSGNDVWITWIGERMDLLEERGVDIPINKKIRKLVLKYYGRIEKELR